MKFYNTLFRKKQVFKPIKGKAVGIYTCGPTVYDYAHIGNLRSYIFADTLHRALEENNFKVKHVINITDVGHLTSDEDEGEDKIERAAKDQKKSAKQIARFFENQFKIDVKKLNCVFADKYVRATEHIKEQIEIVKILEKKGFTYKTKDGIYFDTSKFKNYGKLAGQRAEEKKAGARVKMRQKKNITDFALWKFSPEGSKRQMEWDSPWGRGFPGWHLECSAMSRKYLGQPFDIHTGGIDHIPVHHTNEIAQSEAAFGKTLAKYWLHSNFLTVKGGRMGKSEGNLIKLSEVEEKGYKPSAYRYFVLLGHYRTKLNFTWEALDAAARALKNLKKEAENLGKPKGGCLEFEKKFFSAIDDDLNTPKAIGVMWEMLKSNCASSAKAASLLKFDKVLGLGIEEFGAKKIIAPKSVTDRLKMREDARKKKDWKRADKIRKEIERMGYDIEDTKTGAKIVKK